MFVDGHYSSEFINVISGVPKGGVRGLIFFQLFIRIDMDKNRMVADVEANSLNKDLNYMSTMFKFYFTEFHSNRTLHSL